MGVYPAVVFVNDSFPFEVSKGDDTKPVLDPKYRVEQGRVIVVPGNPAKKETKVRQFSARPNDRADKYSNTVSFTFRGRKIGGIIKSG